MSEIDENDLLCKKQALVAVARRCFERGLQSNAGGNLSVRLGGTDALVIKPSGVGFNECSVDNLMVADLDGRTLRGHGRPSKDLDFHAGIYKVRPDVGAIVHVHSPWATGYASAGLEIPCLTVQSVEKMGRVPLIGLSAAGGPQGAAEISPVMKDPKVKAAVLANHGTIGVGPTLLAAQYLVEMLEETAQIAFVRDTLVRTGNLEAPAMPVAGTKDLA